MVMDLVQGMVAHQQGHDDDDRDEGSGASDSGNSSEATNVVGGNWRWRR